MPEKKRLPSLRSRYIVFTLVLAAITSVFALSNYRSLAQTTQHISLVIEKVDLRIETISEIKRRLNAVYRAIDLFLLDPSDEMHTYTYRENLERAIVDAQRFIEIASDHQHEHAHVYALLENFNKLMQEGDELFAIRVDAARQYPALGISSTSMLGKQSDISNNFVILLTEIESQDFKPRSAELYPLILKAQSQWNRLISQLRIYLANRFGSFNLSLIEGQERTANDIYKKLQVRLARIGGIYALETDSFVGPGTIQDTATLLASWFDGLQRVFEVNRSDRWREDAYRMKEIIIPLIGQIDATLSGLLEHLKYEERLSHDMLIQHSNEQLWAQVLIIVTFIVFLFLLLLSLDFLIFRPVEKVASLLRAKTIDEEDVTLPAIHAREIQHLVESFEKMRIDLQSGHRSLQESESRFREIAENIREVFWVSSPDWQAIHYISPHCDEIWGISCDRLYEDPTLWLKAIHPDDVQMVRDAVNVIADGKAESDLIPDHRIILPDGELKWISARAYHVSDVATGQARIIGVMEDITKQKVYEEALARSQKMEAIGQLSGGIAHDFNNILGIIMGNLELAEIYAQDKPEVVQRIENALSGANRGAQLTKRLLAFSRKDRLGQKTVNINQVVEDMHNLISKSLTSAVEVSLHLSYELWNVSIDPGDLEDAILNLALNSRDAMPSGGKLVIETTNEHIDEHLIRMHPDLRKGDYVRVSVSDTGAGMPKDVQEKIFDPFFTTKERGKGTGLGLSMVYGFVERSNGFLKVYSELGIGTSFHLYFPRTASQADAVENEPEALPPTGDETILVVDDEELLLEIAVAYLQELGYQTLKTPDAKQALEIIRSRDDIDLIFSDVVMPGGMDGYQLAVAARKVRPEIRVLLTSGFTSKREELANGERELYAELSRHLLSKPYNRFDLATAIRRQLDA